jgi:hypothetical protein
MNLDGLNLHQLQAAVLPVQHFLISDQEQLHPSRDGFVSQTEDVKTFTVSGKVANINLHDLSYQSTFKALF